MRYGIVEANPGWFVSVRSLAGGFRTALLPCLQDAYAWLYRLGAFERRDA